MSTSEMKRELSVRDTEARSLIEFLVDLFGTESVQKCIKRANMVIAMEKGIYLNYLVMPNLAFWLGVEECLIAIDTHGTLAGHITEKMHAPIELAVKLQLFSRSMPQERLNEFIARILASDQLAAVLLEIDSAAHYWQLGYEIEWSPNPKGKGIRVPEFVAVSGEKSVEIECKSQSPDSGRMITRSHFYRVADDINSLLSSLHLAGKVLISVPSHLPRSNEWKNELLNAIRSAAETKSNSITLADKTTIDFLLVPATSFVVPQTTLLQEVTGLQVPFSHIVVAGSQTADAIRSPVIVRIQSVSTDELLSGYLDDLRDANRHSLVPKLA